MNNLYLLRKNWDTQEGEEIIPPEATTIQERLDQWKGMQMAFEWQLRQTATLFEHDRWNALIGLQSRLQSLSKH